MDDGTPMLRTPLPVETTVKLAIGMLACVLSVASMHRPEIADVRAMAAFALAWAYTAGVLGRQLLAERLAARPAMRAGRR